MEPGIAAGNPATAAAGAEILADGGNAADAAVAASLASCVAETVMTGPARRRARDLLGRGVADGARTSTASAPCRRGEGADAARAAGAVRRGARPLRDRAGVVRGARRAGRARRAARAVRAAAVARPLRAGAAARARRRRDAAGAGLVPRDARAGDDDGRGRAHLRAGRTCSLQAGRHAAAARAREGAGAPARRGRARRRTPARSPRSLLVAHARRGAASSPPTTSRRTRRAGASRSRSTYAGTRVLTRGGLCRTCRTLLPRLPRAARSERDGARARARCPRSTTRGAETHTTNPSRRRRARGTRASFTTSLGLGSGDFLPGPRPAPEQHARRDRPRRRRARARASG